MTAPNSFPPPNCTPIDGETSAACDGFLRHGDPLTSEQMRLLLDGRPAEFIATLDNDDVVRVRPELREDRSAPLPPTGRWEYKVIALTELLGLATAKGTG